MNQEQILQLIVHVLHAMGASSKSTAIAEYAMSHSFTRHAIGHSFDLHAFSDVHVLSSKITSTISSHKRDSSPRSCMIEGRGNER
jgi:phosphoribosyl-dephospho-CoA transferase